MPYTVHKHGSKWAIVNKRTGKRVGYSKTKTKAKKSASIRNRAHR